jgi:hypothetical protein
MNHAFLGSLGLGHTSSWVAQDPLEGLADDRTTASSYDGRMTGGSTLAATLPEQEVSATSTSWPAGGCSASGLAASPPDPDSSDQEGEPCVPSSGREPGLPLSSTTTDAGGIARVTSDPASIVTIVIAAIIVIVTVAVPTTNLGGTTPEREGRTTASLLSPLLVTIHYKLGLHSSRTGGGAMLNPVSIWSLSEKYRSVALKKLKI